jgi:dephospho-CoA kinase
MLKVALTGSIACGKSKVTEFLREAGIGTVDADDIVHELVPEEERRRLAKTVFADPVALKALEAKLHPEVKRRIGEFFRTVGGDIAVAVIPLLFEARWDGDYDIICTVVAPEQEQIRRMTENRGYSRDEAENRMARQMPQSEKASRSHYVITNDASVEELRRETARFVGWLKEKAREKARDRKSGDGNHGRRF